MKTQPLQESKAQNWRALAILDDGSQALLCLGGSIVQVRQMYREPWFDLFDEEVRNRVEEIELQKWSGAPDRGEWQTTDNLPIPLAATA